jgi:rhodanese-related sulfurtransferase
MAIIGEIEPTELQRRLGCGGQIRLLDVREAEEVAIAPFPGAIHLPMAEVPSHLDELPADAEWVIICHHGLRSAQVAAYLAKKGFERVTNLIGGIDRWSLTVDQSVPRY